MEENLNKLIENINLYKDKISTEEATKTSLIIPFFELLGYDIRNPLEFTPEFVADVGTKKGEKVDYAITLNDKLQILIEAKTVSDNLTKHYNQLVRYFSVTKAKIAILTNGIIYKFFTDLDEPNMMDEKPFLEIDLLNLNKDSLNEIKKFAKEEFDINKIILSAENLKYANEVKKFLLSEIFEEQGENFIDFVMSQTYDGRKSKSWKMKMTAIIKNTFSDVLEDVIAKKTPNIIPEKNKINNVQELEENLNNRRISEIVTTDEELEGYSIICNILDNLIRADRISYKDTVNYFSILLDGSTQKWICRFYFNYNQKYISLPDITYNGKSEIRIDINSLEDIHNYSNDIKKSALKISSMN